MGTRRSFGNEMRKGIAKTVVAWRFALRYFPSFEVSLGLSTSYLNKSLILSTYSCNSFLRSTSRVPPHGRPFPEVPQLFSRHPSNLCEDISSILQIFRNGQAVDTLAFTSCDAGTRYPFQSLVEWTQRSRAYILEVLFQMLLMEAA